MMFKGDFPRERNFPDDEKEKVFYSIDVISKVYVKREGSLPRLDAINKDGDKPKNNIWSIGHPGCYCLFLYYYTSDPLEIRYLWTAAILFGFHPETIRCSENERNISTRLGGIFYTNPYDQSNQLKGTSTFSDSSLFTTKFVPYLPENIDEWVKNIKHEHMSKYRQKKSEEENKRKIEEELQKKEKEEQQRELEKINEQEKLRKEQERLERLEREKIEELKMKKDKATAWLMNHEWEVFSLRRSLMSYLDDGADINCRNSDGYTPLIKAVTAEDDALAEFILQQGANPLIRTNDGKLASDFANHSTPLYQLLKQKEREAVLEKLSPPVRYSELLHDAMGTFEISCRKIDAFLEQGADVNYQDKDGFTVLMLAVDKDNERIAEYILRCGADPTLKNNKGKTARDYSSRNSGIFGVLMGYELIFLTQCGNLRALQTLLCFDDNIVNFRCHRGYTALLIAVEKGFFEVVKLLLAKGADISMLGPDGLAVFDLTENRDLLVLLKLAASEQGFEVEDSEITKESGNSLINESNRFFSDSVLRGNDQKEATQPIAEVALHASEFVQIDNDSGIIYSLNKGPDVNF